jgi:hypothetical protein
MRLSFRLGGPSRAVAQLESYGLPEDFFQRLHVPVRRPQLELGVRFGAQAREEAVGLRIEIDGRHRLRVAAIETLGHADHRRQTLDGALQLR